MQFYLEFEPYLAGRAERNLPTSIQAEESILLIAHNIRLEVLACLKKKPATCCELEDVLALSHQTCSARITELRQRGEIFDSGARRKTHSGRNAIVWAAT